MINYLKYLNILEERGSLVSAQLPKKFGYGPIRSSLTFHKRNRSRHIIPIKSSSPCVEVTHLVFNEHRNVEEHVVQLGDGLLQFDEHFVPVLDVVDRLPELILVTLNLWVKR